MSEHIKLPKLRVIDGGKSRSQPANPSTSNDCVKSADDPSLPRELRQLRRAILNLQIEEVSKSVEECLQAISDTINSLEDDDFVRTLNLIEALEAIGLKFCLARPEMDLLREGYLMLCWPSRLLNKCPEIARLHPEAHLHITLG